MLLNTIPAYRRCLCFKCGQEGHKAADCTFVTGTAEGKEAFHRHVAYREKTRKKAQHNYYFYKVIQWMKESQMMDPLAVTNNESTRMNGSTNQRCHDLHKAKYNDLNKAYRKAFGCIIDQVKTRLADRLNVSPADEAASQWREELSRAVILGRPADFSTIGDDDVSDGNDNARNCIKVYAVEKLKARCRQLNLLLLYDNSFCARIRSKFLLPSSTSATTNVISIGGGPGYDHISFCIAARFLHEIQPMRSQLKMKHIKTQVYDLFDKDWEPVMNTLQDCFHESCSSGDDHDKDDLENCVCASKMTMHHLDLRLGLDESENEHLRTSIKSADIICAQFVLHENAAYIIRDEEIDGKHEQRISGTMRDILVLAPLGAMMICCDSSNALFPHLRETAEEYGWCCLGDEEPMRDESKKLAHMGPKSFLLSEKMHANSK